MAKAGFTTDNFTIDTGVVDGQTIAKWTSDWWTWALNLKTGGGDDPFTQPDGTHIGNHMGGPNDGPVVFIPGVQQTGQFDVAFGKALLVPLVNAVFTPPSSIDFAGRNPNADLNSIHSVENAFIKNFDNSLSDLFAKVDGITIPDLASSIVDTSFFDPGVAKAGTLAPDFFGNVPASWLGKPMGPAKSGGAWLMIDNLSRGTHTLEFGGKDSLTAQDLHITDTFTVS